MCLHIQYKCTYIYIHIWPEGVPLSSNTFNFALTTPGAKFRMCNAALIFLQEVLSWECLCVFIQVYGIILSIKLVTDFCVWTSM